MYKTVKRYELRKVISLCSRQSPDHKHILSMAVKTVVVRKSLGSNAVRVRLSVLAPIVIAVSVSVRTDLM